MTRALMVVLCLVLAPLPAVAHKVVAAAYPGGDVIEGEVGFSNGDMAADLLIEVFDAAGNRLGQARTDADGFFTYRPTTAVRHVFRADLGAGHVAQFDMAADEVAAIVGTAPPAPVAAASTFSDTGPALGSLVDIGATPVIAALGDADKAAIAQIVRDETRPLRREIAAYRDHHDLQTILGGIGYIVGIFGIGFYIAARRRMAG